MKIVNKILLSAVTGTTLMTAFSYLLSRKAKEQFREPVLLGDLLSRAGFNQDKALANGAGWVLHYVIGIGFVMAYGYKGGSHFKDKLNGNHFLIGIVSGLAGVTSWATVLAMHPNPPRIKVHKFFAQLVVAHIIFRLGCLSYNLDIHNEEAVYMVEPFLESTEPNESEEVANKPFS